MTTQVEPGLAALLTAALIPAAYAAGDPAHGAQLFRQCASCHSTVSGDHMTGPSLAHVWNRKAGIAADFARYSDALARSGLTWDEANLDKWLAGPEKFLPGNSMTFSGVPDSQARRDLIAYLKALDEDKAPPAAKGAGPMMGAARPRLDFRNPPPAGEVRSIKYCGDTYAVETADGRIEKIWEFKLRFKSDSSKLDPAPGKPVPVEAGMRGDRLPVIFAAPGEISRFAVLSCS